MILRIPELSVPVKKESHSVSQGPVVTTNPVRARPRIDERRSAVAADLAGIREHRMLVDTGHNIDRIAQKWVVKGPNIWKLKFFRYVMHLTV